MKKSSKDVINYKVIHNNYMTNLWFKCRLAELEEGEKYFSQKFHIFD